jgi:hypothetical protein
MPRCGSWGDPDECKGRITHQTPANSNGRASRADVGVQLAVVANATTKGARPAGSGDEARGRSPSGRL